MHGLVCCILIPIYLGMAPYLVWEELLGVMNQLSKFDGLRNAIYSAMSFQNLLVYQHIDI